MKNRIILITLASLMTLTGCKQKPVEDKSASFDWDNNDKREYIIDYSVLFTADHDSTIQVTATGNYGTVKVAQVESKNLLDADGKPVKNTFIILEDSVPMGKSITLQRGCLSYVGGEGESGFIWSRYESPAAMTTQCCIPSATICSTSLTTSRVSPLAKVSDSP